MKFVNAPMPSTSLTTLKSQTISSFKDKSLALFELLQLKELISLQQQVLAQWGQSNVYQGISHPCKNHSKVIIPDNQDQMLYSDKKPFGKKRGKMLEAANCKGV